MSGDSGSNDVTDDWWFCPECGEQTHTNPSEDGPDRYCSHCDWSVTIPKPEEMSYDPEKHPEKSDCSVFRVVVDSPSVTEEHMRDFFARSRIETDSVDVFKQ
ncbi:hypothetical protein ACOJIV_17710 [Haloarcula sp. AONF1]